jgi:biopolymer transport protein ExbB/TolQ
MAYNMQVAFATTVVGMVISAIGFITQQTKERWFVKNLTTLEYVADLITKSKEDKQ